MSPAKTKEKDMEPFPFYSLAVRPMQFVHDQTLKGWELKFDVPLTQLTRIELVHYIWESKRDYEKRIQHLENERKNANLSWERKNAARDLSDHIESWERYHNVLSGKMGQLAGQQHAEAILYRSASERWYQQSPWERSRCLIFLGTIWEDPQGVLCAPCLQIRGHMGLELDFRPIDAERARTALSFIGTNHEG